MDDDTSRMITGALCKLGLGSAGDIRGIAQLTGGVSSDIWRIDFADRGICAKRALSKLKVDRYPIVSMEDGFAEDDNEGMCAMTARLGHRLQIIGDDFFVTNARQIDSRLASRA